MPRAVEAHTLNPWTSREVPLCLFGVLCWALRFSSTVVALQTQRARVVVHGCLSEISFVSVEVRKTLVFFWVSVSAVTAS